MRPALLHCLAPRTHAAIRLPLRAGWSATAPYGRSLAIGLRYASTSVADATEKTPKTTDKTWSDVKRLFSLAKPQRKPIALGVGLMLVHTSISMSVPLALGKVLDVFTNQAPQLPISLPMAAGVLLLTFVVGAAANVGRIVVMRIAGQRIITDARKTAFEKVLKQDLAWYDMQGQKPLALAEPTAEELPKEEAERVRDEARHSPSTSPTGSKDAVKSTGDILSRLGTDANLVGDSITREVAEGLKAVLTAIIGVGAMALISAKLTVLVMFLIPPSAIGAVVYGRYIKKLSRSTQKAIAKMVSVAEERIQGIRTVQAFNAVQAEVKHYNEKVENIFQLVKRDAWASALFYSGLGLIGNVSIIALLSYGGSLVSGGELTVGQLTSLAFYAIYVGGSISSLTSFYSTIMRGLGASGRLFELMDAKPRFVQLGVGRHLLPSEPSRRIVFKDVSFAYPTRPNSKILNHVNLAIEPGTSIAFAGGSGSGKSTLALLLLRFYAPTSGQILYGEEDLSTLTPESWRERIAFVDQSPLLWGMTVTENIVYGKPDATFEEVREAAIAAHALDFIEALPQGFDTRISRSTLSGGQTQRLAIARALIKKPKILVMDEATSALDSASEALVNDAVTQITKSNSLTTILIAHRLSTLKTASQVAFVENGQIVEVGSFAELSARDSRFSALVRNQMLTRSREQTERPDQADTAHLT